MSHVRSDGKLHRQTEKWMETQLQSNSRVRAGVTLCAHAHLLKIRCPSWAREGLSASEKNVALTSFHLANSIRSQTYKDIANN